MSTPEPRTRARATRWWPYVSGGTALVAALGLGLVVTLRASPLGLDAAWMQEITDHRSDLWLVPSLVMNTVGGGILGAFILPLLTTVLLVVFGRPWGAVYFLLATVVSAGIVHLLKATFGRARPADILVNVDAGSFPSGHVTNAATLAVSLAFIVARTWVWYAGSLWVVLMSLSRTYLGAHWVTDTVGGALLGAAVAVLIWAPFATRLGRESWRLPWRRASVGV